MAYPVIRQAQAGPARGGGIGYLHVGEWADRRGHLPTRCRPLISGRRVAQAFSVGRHPVYNALSKASILNYGVDM